MTKSDLINRLYESSVVSTKNEARDIVEIVFAVMKDALASGENIKLSSFGNFVVKEKHACHGRNPKTGEAIAIREHKIVKFRASAILKDAANAKRSG